MTIATGAAKDGSLQDAPTSDNLASMSNITYFSEN